MVVNRRDFMAFGEEAISVQRVGGGSGNGYEAAGATRKDYTGYEKDEESGLEFAQARYYNATHGRFTSVDPLTASATIRNPQTFNRYSYGLNSPYKFTDPLGLLSEYTTGACGSSCPNSESRWTQSSGGPMTGGGTESPFAAEFEAMSLYREVDQALDTLSGVGFETYGNYAPGEKAAVTLALQEILRKGTQEAKRIAANIVNSDIRINIGDYTASGQTLIRDAAGLTAAIAQKGTLTIRDALSFFQINLDRGSTMNSAPDLLATLVHEGKHAEIYATVAVSLSSGDPRKFENETMRSDEIRASTAATQFLIRMGGEFMKKGQALGFITNNGRVDSRAMNAKGAAAAAAFGTTKTVQDFFKLSKVTW